MTGDIFCKCDCCALYNKTFLLRPSAKVVIFYKANGKTSINNS